MDPVTIIDHYRLSLVHSREGIQVLAHLLRDGPQNLADLAESIESGPPETDRQLNSLYRAALVKKLGADLWSVSPLAEQVLTGLGVVELAAADLAESQADTEPDRFFLRTWLRRMTRDRDSHTCLSLLRSLRQVEASDIGGWSTSKASHSPILYAIVIAADSWAQRTGVENVLEVLTHGHGARFLDAESDAMEASRHDDTIAAAWQAGMKHYRDSNRLLLFIPHEAPAQTDQETLRFTWLRAVDASMRGSADEGLRASCSRWQSHDASAFWKFMFKQRFVERQTRVLCRQKGWLDQPRLKKDLLDGLVVRMMNAVGDTTPSESCDSGGIRGLLIGDTTPSESCDLGGIRRLFIGEEFRDLVDRLGRASNRVAHEGVVVIPDGVRGALTDALDHLSSVMREPSADPEGS